METVMSLIAYQGNKKQQDKRRNIKAFNVITRINEAKPLVKHISCDCKCRFNRTKCNLNLK